MSIDQQNRYKKMMDQIEPERELRAEDLEEAAAGRQKLTRRYFLVLVPAALVVIAVLLLPFFKKQPEGPESVASNQNTEAEVASETGTEMAMTSETGTEAFVTTESEAEKEVVIVDQKAQTVGAVRLYFDQMEKDLEENTTLAFMEKYPETGEAYRRYYEYLHSGNRVFKAEMVYAWFTPGHPEEEDGDYLLLGIRVKMDSPGSDDRWAYHLNYLYHYDESSGTLTPVNYPGEQIYPCYDFSLLAENHEVEWHTANDGRVLNELEVLPYYDENGAFTISMESYRQIQTESYFTINEAGEIVIEGQYNVMDITTDFATGEGTDLADPADKAAADEMRRAHRVMEPLMTEGILSWQKLYE